MSTKQKKTIQKGSFKRLLKLFFFKNKMLTALMLFSIIISAVATALGPQYLGYATDSIVQDMSNPVSSNIHWDRFFFWAGISSMIFLCFVILHPSRLSLSTITLRCILLL